MRGKVKKGDERKGNKKKMKGKGKGKIGYFSEAGGGVGGWGCCLHRRLRYMLSPFHVSVHLQARDSGPDFLGVWLQIQSVVHLPMVSGPDLCP